MKGNGWGRLRLFDLKSFCYLSFEGGKIVLILKQYSSYRCFQTPSLIQGNKIPFSNKPRFRDGACSNINISQLDLLHESA